MTTPETARALALVAAAQARIFGMVAENMQRQICGSSMAYDYNDFAYEADQLERIAQEVANQ